MNASNRSDFFTTAPVLLWSSGGRTAWGRAVDPPNALAAERLHGGERCRDPFVQAMLTGVIPCHTHDI